MAGSRRIIDQFERHTLLVILDRPPPPRVFCPPPLPAHPQLGGILVRQPVVVVCVFLMAAAAFAQSDRGTVTGTVADQTSAVIPGARIVATNAETSARFETRSTETGNYTL